MVPAETEVFCALNLETEPEYCLVYIDTEVMGLSYAFLKIEPESYQDDQEVFQSGILYSFPVRNYITTAEAKKFSHAMEEDFTISVHGG